MNDHKQGAEPRLAELAWYRQHGRYPDRVVTRNGKTWVVGDWAWNRLHPRRQEYIEARIYGPTPSRRRG